MNLLNKIIPKNKILSCNNEISYTINEYRSQQYNMIPLLIKNAIDYLSVNSNNKIKYSNYEKYHIVKYLDVYGYDLDKYIINIENEDNNKLSHPFVSFNLPSLIKKNFFYLNGSFYAPCLYILDQPIIYKNISIKLYGLINSLTLFFKPGNTRAIFCGRNIPLDFFLQWFVGDNDELLEKIYQKYNYTRINYPKNQLLEYFSNFFNCEMNEQIINTKFNNMFFDNYTKDLYFKTYKRHFTFQELINYCLCNYFDENRIPDHFVDLRTKRLVFVELLLSPFFSRIGEAAFCMCKGQTLTAMNFNESEIIKNFMMNLKHQYFYDLVNFYSGIIIHKASFLNPNSSVAPTEISAIHKSHFQKICPITISAKKPGESVSIISQTRVDEYGLFVFNN